MSINQPRNDKGQFVDQPSVSSSGTTKIRLSEFECRIVGNRLYEVSQWYKKSNEQSQVAGECLWWSKKLHDKCKTRSDPDGGIDTPKRHTNAVYEIVLELSEFEAKYLGDRLWEAGMRYSGRGEDEVAKETKFWARRFHAEAGEVVNNNE